MELFDDTSSLSLLVLGVHTYDPNLSIEGLEIVPDSSPWLDIQLSAKSTAGAWSCEGDLLELNEHSVHRGLVSSVGRRARHASRDLLRGTKSRISGHRHGPIRNSTTRQAGFDVPTTVGTWNRLGSARSFFRDRRHQPDAPSRRE